MWSIASTVCCVLVVQRRGVRALVAGALAPVVLVACGSSAGEDAIPPSAAVPSGLVGQDQDVVFTSGGVDVHGSLRLPVDPDASMPAALIIAGSGATDRNGNAATLPNVRMDMYEWLADQLSAAGYASLRYDKLGSGQTGIGTYTPQEAAQLSFEDTLLRDAQDALAFLGQQPGIDSTRLAVVGHSEGGMIALALADAPGTAPAPRRLALIEPLPVPILGLIESQLSTQIEQAASSAAISDEDASALSTWLSEGIDLLRSGSSSSSAVAPLPGATGAAKDLQDAVSHYVYNPVTAVLRETEDRYDPRELASRYDVPGSVLVTCGTKDVNTPCSLVEALAAAFPAGVARLVVIPNLIHVLRDVGDAEVDGIPVERYPDYPFSDELAGTLSAFLR